MKKTLIALASFLGLIPSSLAKDYAFKIDAIAAVLMAEGRGEGVTGMAAIAECIRNRGRNPFEVITEPRQFSCLNGCSIEELIRRMRRHRGWRNATTIAATLLANPAALGNTVRGADHYDGARRRPAWAAQMRVTVTIANHRFYASR